MSDDHTWTWPLVTKRTRQGPIDEILKITAGPGTVEITFDDEHGGYMKISIPSEKMNQLIDKLSTARDAAALMGSTK